MTVEKYTATITEKWYSKGLWIKIEAEDIDELRLIRKQVMEGLDKIKEVNQ